MAKDKSKNMMLSSKKTILIGVIVIAVLAIIVAVIMFLLWRGSPAVKLMSSIRNTVKLEQQKITVTVTSPKSSVSGRQNTLTLSSEYRKGQGISATATNSIYTDLVGASYRTAWVIDSSNTIYTNNLSTDLTYTDKGKQEAASLGTTPAAMSAIVNKATNEWGKIGTTSTSLNTSYGFDPCLLSATYHVLNDPNSFTDLLGSIASSKAFSFTHSGLSDVVVTPNPSTKTNADSVYAKSDLNTFLTKCNSNDFGQSLSSMLSGASIDAKIDTGKNVVSAITITADNGTVSKFTFATANNVTITVPALTPPSKATPGETAAQYVQSTQPFIYQHLQDYNQVTQQLIQQARQAAQKGE